MSRMELPNCETLTQLFDAGVLLESLESKLSCGQGAVNGLSGNEPTATDWRCWPSKIFDLGLKASGL